MKKIITAIILLMISVPSYALRCGGKIITEGDPLHKVEQHCNSRYSYTVNNVVTDEKYVYVGKEELHIIDGHVQEINR